MVTVCPRVLLLLVMGVPASSAFASTPEDARHCGQGWSGRMRKATTRLVRRLVTAETFFEGIYDAGANDSARLEYIRNNVKRVDEFVAPHILIVAESFRDERAQRKAVAYVLRYGKFVGDALSADGFNRAYKLHRKTWRYILRRMDVVFTPEELMYAAHDQPEVVGYYLRNNPVVLENRLPAGPYPVVVRKWSSRKERFIEETLPMTYADYVVHLFLKKYLAVPLRTVVALMHFWPGNVERARFVDELLYEDLYKDEKGIPLRPERRGRIILDRELDALKTLCNILCAPPEFTYAHFLDTLKDLNPRGPAREGDTDDRPMIAMGIADYVRKSYRTLPPQVILELLDRIPASHIEARSETARFYLDKHREQELTTGTGFAMTNEQIRQLRGEISLDSGDSELELNIPPELLDSDPNATTD